MKKKMEDRQGKHERKLRLNRLLAATLTLALVVALFPAAAYEDGNGAAVKAEESVTLQNPRIVPDDSMNAGQKVTWDCVWFGSYPQAEVVTTQMSENYTALDESLLREGDLFVSDSVYSALENEDGWDDNNDITLGGEKYRRMKEGDVTTTSSYNWPDGESWHYFKYEPIKWRVLETDGSQALLLSDVALDEQIYILQHGIEYSSATWESSTVRSWLNGYGSGSNQEGIDYSGKNFLDSAFSAAEQAAIVNSTLENADNQVFGTWGGNATTDKVFFLSESDVWNTDKAAAHGFVKDCNTCDEARRSKSSIYAKAMGARVENGEAYAGNCEWWLRSPGDFFGSTRVLEHGGYSYCGYVSGVRAALNLDLSSSNFYTYAGIVCSDGTDTEVGGGENPEGEETGGNTGNSRNPSSHSSGIQTPPTGLAKGQKQTVMGNTYVGLGGETVAYLAPENKKLTSLAIPATVKVNGVTCKVTEIKDNAFKNCRKLKTVTIGSNITKIGKNAFYGCRKLKTVNIKTTKLTKKNVGKNAFKNISAKATVKVPKKKFGAYKKLLRAKGLGKKVEIKK